jgi:hypothetical protein
MTEGAAGGHALYTVVLFERIVEVAELADDRPAGQWLADQLARCGLPIDGDPAGGSVATTWFELPATARVLDEDFEGRELAYMVYRALVLEVDRAAVLARSTAGQEGPRYQWRAAVALRDLCDALDPALAFVRRDPVDDIARFVDDLWPQMISSGFAQALSTYNFPLWYVQQRWADDVPGVPGQTRLPELPARRGTLVLTGRHVEEWMVSSVDDWLPIPDDDDP